MPNASLKLVAAMAVMVVAVASALVPRQGFFLPEEVSAMLSSTPIGEDFNLVRSYGFHIAAAGAAITVLGHGVLARLLAIGALVIGGLTMAAMAIAMGVEGLRLLPQNTLIYVGAYSGSLVFLLWYGRTRLLEG